MVIMPRILLVADISNLYYCTLQKYSAKINFKSLLSFIASRCGGTITRAIAYGADMDNQASAFKNALKNLGFEIKYKAPNIYFNKEQDGSVSERRKADWDVGMAMDVVSFMDDADIVVFATSDGDLLPCVTYAISHGKECFAIGTHVSSALRDAIRCFEITSELLEKNVAKC